VLTVKIDFQGSLPAYRKTNGQPAAKANTASAAPAAKTDVVDISRGQSPVLTGSLAALKSSILQDINVSTSAGKLEELQSKIRSGSYHPSTDEIIDAILSE
jgi:anti-sigma28 factor (negative regulator of flagellin synthesis)